MTISRDEALDAIHQLERTEARAFDARFYRRASSQLILWGLIWVIGYTLTGVWPDRASLIWLPLTAAGVFVGFILMRRAGGPAPGSRFAGLRWAVQALIWVLFMVGIYVVFPVTSPTQTLALPCLVIAFVYALVGSVRLTRLLWIGAVLFALTIGGVLFLKPVLAFWLAAVGGGALIGGGLWLRSA